MSTEPNYDDAVYAFGRAYSATKCEAHVIWHLMCAHHPVRYEILDSWPTGRTLRDSSLNVQILKVRTRLAPHGLKIKNVWGRGYYVDDAVRAELCKVAEGRAL